MVSHQTLRRLVYFAAIAEAGSIRGAAARLNLSVPVVSEALSELEAELGVSLATRTTRQFVLTDAGSQTQIAAQKILDMAQGLTQSTSPAAVLQGTLRMTVAVELAGFWLPEKLKSFGAQFPDVTFDIDVTDSVVDLRASSIEVAIRTDYVAPGEKHDGATKVPLVVVAKRSVDVGRGGAVNMPLIDSKSDRKLVATSRKDGSTLPLTFSRIHRITNRSAGLEMAHAGIGAVMVMRGSVAADLAAGRLVEILPKHDFGAIEVRYHFRDRLPSPLAQSFAAHILS